MNQAIECEFVSPSFTKENTIFQNEDTKYIVIGYHNKYPEKLILAKIYYLFNTSIQKDAQNELKLLKKLKKYKHASKLIDSEKYHRGSKKYLAIYQKFYPRGNMQGLLKELQCRNKVIADAIILNMLFSLVGMLSNLQLEGICHRDIKLENIFIDENDEFILGDFGDGKSDIITESNIHTLRGTLNYLSPLLAQKYDSYMNGEGGYYAEHNPYKSDVFSLGLVALNLLTKEEIIYSKNKYLNLINRNQQKLGKGLLKWILDKMLQIDENSRPNFIELYKILLKVKNLKICSVCFNEILVTQPICLDCFAGFHSKCLRKRNLCNLCNSSVFCSSCGNDYVFYLKECNEKKCFKCHISSCSAELLATLDSSVSFKEQVKSLCCSYCNSSIVKENKTHVCRNCHLVLCPRCLRRHLNKIDCLDDFNTLNIRCRCNSSFEYTEGLFTKCANCGMFCKLCLKKDTEVSHVACVEVLNLDTEYFFKSS